jgi:hypothetical protein
MENVFAYSFVTYVIIFVVFFVVGFIYRLFMLINFDVIWRDFQIYMGWRQPYRRQAPVPPPVHPLDENFFPTTPFQQLCLACPELLPRLRAAPSLVHDIQGYVDKHIKHLNQQPPIPTSVPTFNRLTALACLLVIPMMPAVPTNQPTDPPEDPLPPLEDNPFWEPGGPDNEVHWEDAEPVWVPPPPDPDFEFRMALLMDPLPFEEFMFDVAWAGLPSGQLTTSEPGLRIVCQDNFECRPLMIFSNGRTHCYWCDSRHLSCPLERAIERHEMWEPKVLLLDHIDHCLGHFCSKCVPAMQPQAYSCSIVGHRRYEDRLKDEKARKSAVISSDGAHKFKIDNDESSARREDLVHASVPEIHETLSRLSPDVKRNTQKVKRACERLHQKKKFTARDIERCEKAFRKLTHELALDGNEPQFGFNMGELLTKLGAAPGVFISTCTELAKSAKSTADSLSSITNIAKNALPWLSTFIRASVLCVAGSLLIYGILAKRTILAVTAAGLISALALVQGFMYQNELQSVLDALKKKVEEMDPARQYRGVAEDEWIERREMAPQGHTPVIPLEQGLISKLFVSVFSCGFFALGEKNKSTFSVLKDYVVHFPSIIKGIDSAVEFGSKIALAMLNTVRKAMGFELYDQMFEHRDAFCEWIHNVDGFLTQLETHEVQPSPGTLGQIKAYIAEGREKNLFLRSVTDDSGARGRLTAILTRLVKASDLCISHNPAIVSSRPEPVCVYLFGEPGKGKTVFAKLLAKEWLRRTLNPLEYESAEKNINAYVYNRTPETEFWDGYANQTVCIFDDFLQKKEIAGGESAALDLIRSLNGNPALLHMANLSDKGSSYFTSKFVILSCNIKVPNSEAVACIDAVIRRPDYYVAVDFQPELIRESSLLGSSNVDGEMLAVINSLPAWEDKMSVYTLQKYYVTKARQPSPGPSIAPSQLLNDILEKGEMNNKKFEGKLPEHLSHRIEEGKALSQIFRLRQMELLGKQKSTLSSQKDAAPHPIPKKTSATIDVKIEPINEAQGYWDERLTFDRPGGEARLKQYFRLEFAYLDSIRCWGLDDIKTRDALEDMKTFLAQHGISLSEFEVEAHPKITEANRDFHHVKYPTDLVQKVKQYVHQDSPKLTNKEFFLLFFDTACNKVKSLTGSLYSFFAEYWRWIVGAAAAFGVALTLYAGLRTWADADNEGQSLPARQRSRVPAARRGWGVFKNRGAPIKPVSAQNNEAQGSADLQQQMLKLLKHNYHIFLRDDDLKAIGHCQLLVDRVGMINAHIADMIVTRAQEEDLECVWFEAFANKSYRIQVPVDVFERIHIEDDTRDFDLVLIWLGNEGIQQAPDFRRFIPQMADYMSRSQLNVLIPDPVPNGEKMVFQCTSEGMINSTLTGPYTYGAETYSNEVNISYKLRTLAGHCGLPVVTDTVSQGKYFIGIHKCGNGFTGGAAPLCSEFIDREIDELQMICPEMKILSYQDDNIAASIKPMSVTTAQCFPQCYPATVEGVVPAFHATPRSKLKPLPHIDMFEQSTAPAQLDVCKVNGKWVSPYHLNREKIPRKIYSYPKVPQLGTLVSQIMLPPVGHELADMKFWCRRMTYEEALYGIPNTPFSSLDMSTSVGYPFVLTGKTTKKAWLSDPVLAAEVKRQVDVAIALLEKGIRPVFFVMDCLKDERRPLEKVAQAATRVFSAGSFVALILARMFFGGFCAWTQINKIRNGVVIGMNPYSEEFDDMCRMLFRRSMDAFGGDSSKFDLCQHPVLLDALFHAANNWYGDSPDNKIRLILALDFKFARHVTYPVHVSKRVRDELVLEPIPEDPFEVSVAHKIINASDNSQWCFVYSVACGHPSGHYLTACFNSWYSKVKPFVVIQWQLHDLSAVLDIARSLKLVAMAMGDDFLISVHRSIQDIMNAKKFAEFSALYGMIVTREDKQPITAEFTEEALVFLKRTCRYDPSMGRFVGALLTPAIVDAMCWMHKPNPTLDELSRTFDTALMEFSFHGRGPYLEWAPKIQHAARHTLRRPYVALPWAEALANACKLQADYRP